MFFISDGSYAQLGNSSPFSNSGNLLPEKNQDDKNSQKSTNKDPIEAQSNNDDPQKSSESSEESSFFSGIWDSISKWVNESVAGVTNFFKADDAATKTSDEKLASESDANEEGFFASLWKTIKTWVNSAVTTVTSVFQSEDQVEISSESSTDSKQTDPKLKSDKNLKVAKQQPAKTKQKVAQSKSSKPVSAKKDTKKQANQQASKAAKTSAKKNQSASKGPQTPSGPEEAADDKPKKKVEIDPFADQKKEIDEDPLLEKKVNFIVRILPDHEEDRWISKAFEFKIIKDLASIDRLEPVYVSSMDGKSCSSADCKLDTLKDEKIRIYLEGEFDGSDIDYILYDSYLGRRLGSGSLDFSPGTRLFDIRIRAYKAVNEVIRQGGLLDRIKAKRSIKEARIAELERKYELVKEYYGEEKAKQLLDQSQDISEVSLDFSAPIGPSNNLDQNAQAKAPSSTNDDKSKTSGKDKKSKDKKSKDTKSKETNSKDSQSKETKTDKKPVDPKDPEWEDFRPGLDNPVRHFVRPSSYEDSSLFDEFKNINTDGISSSGDTEDLGSSLEDGEELLYQEKPGFFQNYYDYVYLISQQNRASMQALMLGFIIFITLAPVIFFLITNRFKSKKTQRNKSLIPLVLSLALYIFMIVFLGEIDFSRVKSEYLKDYNEVFIVLENLKWALPVLGGILASTVIILSIRSAIPVIHGLEFLEHRMLPLIIRGWLWQTCLRLFYLIPIMFLFALFSIAVLIVFLIDDYIYYSIILPLGGLYVWFWVSHLIEGLAILHDKNLVYGPATKENPWHKCVHRYLTQYFQVNGYRKPPEFINKILFLPHVDDSLDTYGGGLSMSRIVLSRKMLSYALSIPEEAPPKVPYFGRSNVVFEDEFEYDEDEESQFRLPRKDDYGDGDEDDTNSEGRHAGGYGYDVGDDGDYDHDGENSHTDKDTKSVRNTFEKHSVIPGQPGKSGEETESTTTRTVNNKKKIVSFKEYEVTVDGPQGVKVHKWKTTANKVSQDSNDSVDRKQNNTPGEEGEDPTYIKQKGTDAYDEESIRNLVEQHEKNKSNRQFQGQEHSKVSNFMNNGGSQANATSKFGDVFDSKLNKVPGSQHDEHDADSLYDEDEDEEVTEEIDLGKVYKIRSEDDANFTIEIESEIAQYKDFLYGCLLSEMGHILKRGSALTTFMLFFIRISGKLTEKLSQKAEGLFAFYHSNFAHFTILMADSLSPVYDGHDHLLQYLYFIETGEEEALTQNAFDLELRAKSFEILEKVEANFLPQIFGKKPMTKISDDSESHHDQLNENREDTKDSQDTEGSDKSSVQSANSQDIFDKETSLLRKRILWLKGYFYSFSDKEMLIHKIQKQMKQLLLLVFILYASFKALESAVYRVVYNERIAFQIEQLLAEEESDDKKAKDEKDKDKDAKDEANTKTSETTPAKKEPAKKSPAKKATKKKSTKKTPSKKSPAKKATKKKSTKKTPSKKAPAKKPSKKKAVKKKPVKKKSVNKK